MDEIAARPFAKAGFVMFGFGQDCIYLIHIMRKSAARFTDSLIFFLWTLSNSLRNTFVIEKNAPCFPE